MKFKIIDKKNPLAVLGYFSTREIAESFLKTMIPEYVNRGFFQDKTLKSDDFEVREVTR